MPPPVSRRCLLAVLVLHTHSYAKMGVYDCVAFNATEYVELAVRLGTDAPMRQRVEGRIRAAAPRVFNDMESVRAVERALLSALDAA